MMIWRVKEQLFSDGLGTTVISVLLWKVGLRMYRWSDAGEAEKENFSDNGESEGKI